MKTLKQTSMFLALALLTACGQKMGFTANDLNSAKSVDQCVPGVQDKAIPTKFLFIVDMSGSNFDGPYEHPGQATDKNKSFRFTVLNSFFQEHQSSANVSWGFETFNGSAANALIKSSSGVPDFSSAAAMTTALQTFLQTADSGQTPYKAALDMAHTMIQNDMITAVKGTQYRIAFLTDGYPTDYCLASSATDCVIDDASIDSDVKSLINVAPGAVQFSTVYYGLPDSSAAGRLQTMAAVGGGQFVDTNKSSSINLDDVISTPITCPAN